MKISQLDHLVLTVANIQASLNFYSQVLGMQVIEFANARFALSFGKQKINLHQKDRVFSPHAAQPVCGSGDLCLLSETPMEQILIELSQHQVEIIDGPVERKGATGKILSIYIRDPDQNLIEISNPL